MTLPYPIASSQTDAYSPVDAQLMDAIRLDLSYLDANQMVASQYSYQFKVNGNLGNLSSNHYKRLDGAWIAADQTFVSCKALLEECGDGGTLDVDVRRYTQPDLLVQSIALQFSGSINSINRAGSSINTQSISRFVAQISTQSITQWKSTLNVTSIMQEDATANTWRYNLDGAPDSDWVVGDTVTAASCTSGGNNASFLIVRRNADGGNNIVVTNASGVEQDSTTGTLTLRAYKYNYSSLVSTTGFIAGYNAHLSGHTSGANDGELPIYAVNSSGNNIIVKNASGAAQAGVAGKADTNFFVFAFLSSATSDYAVGESVSAQSHTSGNDNGNFPIIAINSGGNNLVLYISAGVTQGGVAGTIDTWRWIVALSSDPSANVSVSDSLFITGATTAANNTTYTARAVNRSASNNIIIYGTGITQQAGAAGTIGTGKRLVSFASDQSATITTASRIKLVDTLANGANDGEFSVVAVNRGGGSNYNAVIDNASVTTSQYGQAGRVTHESKSIFSTRPSIVINPKNASFSNATGRVSSNAVLDGTQKVVTSGTLVMAEIVSLPSGAPRNLTIQLA